MPKMKTHSGAKKRLTKTATGKIKFKKAGGRHNTGGKPEKQMRRIRENAYIAPGMEKRISRLLPNG